MNVFSLSIRVAWGKTGRRGKMGHLTNLVISVKWLWDEDIWHLISKAEYLVFL